MSSSKAISPLHHFGAQMFKNARWRTVDAGEVIYSCDKDIFQLNFIMEGLVHVHTCPGRNFTIGRWEERTLGSWGDRSYQ